MGGEHCWRAFAGPLIRFTACMAIIIIILNAQSVKLRAWILTFISNILQWLSAVKGAQWQITGYVLLPGVCNFPQYNYAMLIPFHQHSLPDRPRLPNCSDVTGLVKQKCVNTCVGLQAVGVQGSQLEFATEFPERGSDAGQATLSSSAAFIVAVVDRVRSNLLNTRAFLVSDAGSTDKSSSCSEARGHMLSRPMQHDLNSDWFS